MLDLPTDASTYQLYQSGVSNPVYSASGTSWAANGLGDGNYSYYRHSLQRVGCSGSSNAASATVLLPPTWVTKPPSLASASDGRDQTTTIYSRSGTSTSVTLGGLVGDTFYYQVQACLSASQCSVWVEAST